MLRFSEHLAPPLLPASLLPMHRNSKLQQITSAIVYFIDRENKKGLDAIKWGDATLWYLDTHEQELETEEELDRELGIVNKVIRRLLLEGSVLMYVGAQDDRDEDDRLIALHPSVDPGVY